MSLWILVDLSYLGHRVRNSLKDLESDEMNTGILFGFFEQIYSICSSPRFLSNQVLIFADSRSSVRSASFPDYKKKRTEYRSPEEWEQIKIMHSQLNILRREVLPAIGFPVYGQKGMESDDLIASAAQDLSSRRERGVIITGDGDLYQCISDYIHWFDPQREMLLDPESFKRKKGISHERWAEVKSIGGCSTDGVPGVRGVSEKGAIDYLKDRIPHHHKRYQEIQRSIEAGDVSSWEALVRLPHKMTKPIRIRRPAFCPEEFFSFCKEFGIRSYLRDPGRKNWEMFFEGKFKGEPRRRMING